MFGNIQTDKGKQMGQTHRGTSEDVTESGAVGGDTALLHTACSPLPSSVPWPFMTSIPILDFPAGKNFRTSH